MVRTFTTGGPTIMSHPIFVGTILPFVLVFTIVFAILQKSKILGDGKKQIDAIVSLIFGLIVISFGNATGIILQLIPFLAVSLVIILVLLLLLGLFSAEGEFFKNFPNWLKWVLVIGSVLAVVIAVVIVTDFWQTLNEWLFISDSSNLFANIIFIAIVVGAIIAVTVSSSKGKSSKSSSS